MYEISEIILYVEEMQEAVEFYRDRLGLNLVYPNCEDFSSNC
ncbi:VOC family protein [Schlesneria sp.]